MSEQLAEGLVHMCDCKYIPSIEWRISRAAKVWVERTKLSTVTGTMAGPRSQKMVMTLPRTVAHAMAEAAL